MPSAIDVYAREAEKEVIIIKKSELQ